MNNQPDLKLKNKQIDILLLVYKFRFLNRIQIQSLLLHKKFNRIIIWLNELSEKKYIVRNFNRTLGGIPAVYFLGTQGRKELLKRKDVKAHLLERVYQEKRTSLIFRKHCMTIADIYLSLLKLMNTHHAKLTFLTKTDLSGIKYLILPHPDAFFSIEQEKVKKRYFLDIFDENTSDKWIHKRIYQYFHYYEENYWQDHNTNPFPDILFICQDKNTKKELEKTIKKRLGDEEDLVFSLTTLEEIKSKGISREILHRVE